VSPAQLQSALAGFLSWFERLSAERTLKAGQPLMNEGRIISGKNGCTVAERPLAESTEAINAERLGAAVTVAQGCPTPEYGSVVEVRPIAADCPVLQRVQNAFAQTGAGTGVAA
jgi:hypothetical protein